MREIVQRDHEGLVEKELRKMVLKAKSEDKSNDS